jgi:tetratricopeptide (TPR) repeat protein
MRRLRVLGATALLATMLVAGCNLLDPVYDHGSDVATLLEDARFARAAGDYDRAINLLERALRIDPNNQTVRLELAITMMRRDQLSLLNLESVTTHLLSGMGASGAAGRPGGEVSCTFPDTSIVEPFDPRAVEDFPAISAARPAIERVLELLTAPASSDEAPAMPAAFTELQICDAIVDGELAYDREAVLAALNARFDTHEQVTSALTMTAVSLTLAAYVALFEQPDLEVSWFTVDGEDIGGCVAAEHYDLFVQRAQEQVGRAGRALLALDLLLAHSGNAGYATYVDDALALYQSIETAETNPCFIPD